LQGDDPKQIRIYFELESRPVWAPSHGADIDDVWVEFEMKPNDMIAAATSLENDLKKFPRRAWPQSKRR
ncbi:MAG: hypothetical protein PSX80_05645, partial [bacterium]|nr:hypothetical protein [bacterium]